MALSLEYAPIVLEKLHLLKEYLTDEYEEKTAVRILAHIADMIERLKSFPESGVNISRQYAIDTVYWYLFTDHNYFVYRFDANTITVIQMFNEKEDFMKKLFGLSGRTQESIDYWGE